LQGGAVGQERRSGVLETGLAREPVGRGDRDAILKSLVAERSRLTRAQRLGRLSPADVEYLADLERSIDHWELDEVAQAPRDDVWAQLEGIASSLLAVQAKIERSGR
jgi:hypothetical protein